MVALNFVIMRTSQAKTLCLWSMREAIPFSFSTSFLFYPGVRSTEVIQLLVRLHYDHTKI